MEYPRTLAEACALPILQPKDAHISSQAVFGDSPIDDILSLFLEPETNALWEVYWDPVQQRWGRMKLCD